ncbi:MAG: TRAP transporter small permease [Gammaproteobacteria bacterium]
MDPRTALLRFQRGLTRVETALAGLSLLLLVGLTLAQIVARNAFDTGLPGADAVTRLLVLYVAFLGAALAAQSQRHIRIDVISAWLSDAWLDRLYRPLNALAGLVCVLLAHAAVRFWLDEWQHAAAHDRWQTLIALIIPVGFGLLCVHFLLATLLGPPRRQQAAQ